MSRIVAFLIRLYDQLEGLWEHRHTHHLISSVLVISFLIGIVIGEVGRRGLFPETWHLPPHLNHFFAIELAFTLLLLAELLALVFALPYSVAKAVGKQFEILSLILLRSAFKEFKVFEEPIIWLNHKEAIFKMVADASGGLTIFFLLAIYYHIRIRVAISQNEQESSEFQAYKKLVALFLLLAFFMIGIRDIGAILTMGIYPSSFNTFYTVLIFADIFLVLVALRYTFDYYKVFRYSAFVLATVLIRISLSVPPYVNAIMGVVATLFLLGTTLTYNYFLTNIETDRSS